MSQASTQQINSAKAILGPLGLFLDLSKEIDCPAHKGQHKATLYCFGHKYAGIWECMLSGISDSHIHEHIEQITEEPWPLTPTDTPADKNITICSDCGVRVNEDE